MSVTERVLTPAPASAGPADQDPGRPEGPDCPEGPAIRLLDALRRGDDRAVVSAVGPSTMVTAENLPWSCRGPDEVDTMLREARERFPGLTFESSTRHVGFGLVIEEARVRDVETGAPTGTDASAASYPVEAGNDGHPMWDEPSTRPCTTELVLWSEQGPGPVALPPVPLDLPVRVTVRHDDLQVHDVRLSFPAALLRRALGQYVDPLEMSLSEVQSAFIAPAGADLTTRLLAPAGLVPTAAPPIAVRASAVAPHRTRALRRRRLLIPVVLVLFGLLAGAGWWVVQGTGSQAPRPSQVTPSAGPPTRPSEQEPALTSSRPPPVTRTESAGRPSRAPNVTLRSDLAFGVDSATLSPAARAAVAAVAHQVRRAGLTGQIYVDGYTDDLGSTRHGLQLSQRRADAVSGYLRSQLLGAPVSLVSVGHGETGPVADNATAAGRRQNRRVTVTLPRP